MKKLILAVTVASVLSGCAAIPKKWATSGGSKSDAVVELSYVINMFETVVVDEAQGYQKALKRCKRWGFSAAESMEFESSKCLTYSRDFGCTKKLISKEYQCLD